MAPRETPAKSRAHTPKRWGTGALILAAVVPALLGGILTAWEPYPVRALRDLLFDGYQRLSPRPYDPAVPVRVIAVDDESLKRVGRWPWPRAQLAELIARLGESGASTIAMDVLLAEAEREPSRGAAPDGDRILADTLAQHRVVLGVALAERGAPPVVKAGFSSAGDDPRPFLPFFGGAVLPIEALREPSAGLGAMNWMPDRDLVVREIPTIFNVSGALVPSFDMEALRVAQGASTIVAKASNASGETALGRQTGLNAVKVGALEVPTGKAGAVRIRFAGTRPERTIPAWQILSGAFDRKRIENAIVIVGATASALSDIRATPLEAAVPGVDIHAEVVESLIAGATLTRPDVIPGLEILLGLVGAFLAVEAVRRLSPLLASTAAMALVGAFFGASVYAFADLQQLFDPIWPSLTAFAAYSAAGVIVLRQTERERRQVREAFSRYLSPAIVETLARDPSRLVLGGETRLLTVLFSDIRGFTSRSEALSAEDVVGFLNAIHTPLTDHVLETGGTLDKFIGDGMMAFWNAPLDVPDHTRAALRCALRMQETVRRIDEKWQREAKERGEPVAPVSIGIGLHVGPACVGNVGSQRRFDYSAIGDTVNSAARIEPLCKTFRIGALVSGEAAEAAPDFAFLYVGSVALRGRQTRTRLYAVHGDESAATDEFLSFKKQHDEAVPRCENGDPQGFELLRDCARHPLGARYREFYDMLFERRQETAEAVAL
jgi:adenylate cyclase